MSAFASIETAVQAETPTMRYPDVLGETMYRIGREVGADVSGSEALAFGASVGDWPAFPDSAAALARLHRRYRLIILSNVDRASFARSERTPRPEVRPRRDRGGRRGLQAERPQLPCAARPAGRHRRARAIGCSTWPRASTTTTCRRRPLGSRRCGSTAGTTGRDGGDPRAGADRHAAVALHLHGRAGGRVSPGSDRTLRPATSPCGPDRLLPMEEPRSAEQVDDGPRAPAEAGTVPAAHPDPRRRKVVERGTEAVAKAKARG